MKSCKETLNPKEHEKQENRETKAIIILEVCTVRFLLYGVSKNDGWDM